MSKRSWARHLMIAALTPVPSLALFDIPPPETLRIWDRDPFKAIDPQAWVSPENMTWDDFKAPPDTRWNDPTQRGSIRDLNVALLVVDYDDKAFMVTKPPNSTAFGNSLPMAVNISRESVPTFYQDLLNKPGALNRGHTLHEYWMEDSQGRYGTNVTAFGPYRMPSLSKQYGLANVPKLVSCPLNKTCIFDLQKDAINAWHDNVTDHIAESFEFVFILSAGQARPTTTKLASLASNMSGSSFWSNVAGGSLILHEDSGMGTYAHGLSRLLNISDNYDNTSKTPLHRDYTGPWSIMSHGRFNGPGDHHARNQIPGVQSGSMASLHTMRDRLQLGHISNDSVTKISRDALSKLGVVVVRITARTVASKMTGIRVEMDEDLSPLCSMSSDTFCDGGGYDHYDVEVIDRMGVDSFQSDAGVMISKTKNGAKVLPLQWMIDAKSEDIRLADSYGPNGTAIWVTSGDHRQLLDALFHAGTRSGSEFEYVDKANGLHFYVLDKHRDRKGVLSYTVGVRSLNVSSSIEHGIKLLPGFPIKTTRNSPITRGVFCAFELTNTGTYEVGPGKAHPDLSDYVSQDIYRIEADVRGLGWKTELPTAVVAAKYGETVMVPVALAADIGSKHYFGVMRLRAKSESNPRVRAEAFCRVTKAFEDSF